MYLTNHGNDNIWEITKIIRNFIEMLLNVSDSDITRIQNENKRIDMINFNNKSKMSPQSYVLELVNDLRYFDNDHILIGHYFLLDINDQIIIEFKDYVQTIFDTKPIIIHRSPLYRGKVQEIEKHYNTKYQIEWIPGIWGKTISNIQDYGSMIVQNKTLMDMDLPKLSQEHTDDQKITDETLDTNSSQCKIMNIPQPNQFLPEDFTLIENKEEDFTLIENKEENFTLIENKVEDFTLIEYKESERIKKISHQSLGELWYKLDTEHKQPKIEVLFSLLFGEKVLKNKILCELYIKMLVDTLNEKLYPALSLYNYGLFYDNGIDIMVCGYSDKILNIWSSIMEAIREFKCDTKRFNQILENEKKIYQACESFDTQQQLNSQINDLYLNKMIFYEDALKYLESITMIDLIEFEKHLYDNCYYIGLIQGNASMDHCNKFKDIFHKILDLKKTIPLLDPDFPQILKNPTFETKIYNYVPINKKEIDINSSTATIFDMGEGHYNDDKNNLLNQILVTILSDSFFDQLRTKKQLGYLVECSRTKYSFLEKNNGIIKFTIQSSTYDSEYLQTQINEYIENIYESLDQKSFDNCVESIITKLQQPFQSLSASFDYNFNKIFDRRFRFDSNMRNIEIAKQLKYQDLLQYVRDNIVNNQKKIILNVN